MKISRHKKSHKYLSFFKTNFNYREPYQILIDATFCHAALQNKVIIEEQLKKYFLTQIKLLTTQCIILEAESLGAPLMGATKIVKQFFLHKCGHEGQAVTAAECIRSMTKNQKNRYIVASQDRSIQESLRKVPGRCLLYLHLSTPVLEAPSKASKKYVLKKSKQLLPNAIEKEIEHLKQQGLQTKIATDDKMKKLHKRQKNPNPLSCKKKKKIGYPTNVESSIKGVIEKSKTELKSKRKRIKIPKHIKEARKKEISSF